MELSAASVGHLAVKSPIDQAVRLIDFYDCAVLVVLDYLRVKVVLFCASLVKFEVAGVFFFPSREEGLVSINDCVLRFDGLLSVEVEQFFVGIHLELKHSGHLLVEPHESHNSARVLPFSWSPIRRA